MTWRIGNLGTEKRVDHHPLTVLLIMLPLSNEKKKVTIRLEKIIIIFTTFAQCYIKINFCGAVPFLLQQSVIIHSHRL